MHELPIVERILKVAVSHAGANGSANVVSIGLRIGELTDLQEEWMQRYFDYVSKGTLAEGASLVIEWTPVTFRCDSCEKVFPVNMRQIRDVVCPMCAGTKVSLLSGREFFVKEIGVI